MTAIDVAQTAVSGLALGSTYALVALGFVIVFAASRMMNFTQGGFVLVGAYLTYHLTARLGLPFLLSALVSIVLCAGLSVLLFRTVVRRFVGRDSFAMLMVTIGILYVIEALVGAVWGVNAQNMGDPWGVRTVRLGPVVMGLGDVWALGISLVLIAACFAYLRFSTGGLAMRASAADPEAAVSVGINPRRVTYGVWAVAGGLGAVAGTLMATGASGVTLGLTSIVFATLPAIVLGGMASPSGAIVGGFLIGLVQQFTALLQPAMLPELGIRFATVTPFLVLVIVLLLRPQGLFGQKAVARF
ncbi:amino acid/amide ABC transporter membrane protein 1, HAAT family [Raineyella antarctica]|uniref:Amino acid/amide ABC transporter membrane protein 1, HAAT family n=1 Tax=Raineyella antarctica TaxID=1577474 RepID=A0A1G6HPS7_9ACTN|nr:branched-chain amino acid ABC transporter permease [Raineyella antarctica]SDB96153.1 amino acid/amide ABC transporter membrane protein 1, HAAT family [Raineyella antarctica]